jgi:hypothetical protein
MNQVAVKPLVSNQAALERVLSFMPRRYMPLYELGRELSKRRIISVHKPYLGKHPRHDHKYKIQGR